MNRIPLEVRKYMSRLGKRGGTRASHEAKVRAGRIGAAVRWGESKPLANTLPQPLSQVSD